MWQLNAHIILVFIIKANVQIMSYAFLIQLDEVMEILEKFYQIILIQQYIIMKILYNDGSSYSVKILWQKPTDETFCPDK